MSDQLSMEEINAMLQEAALRDRGGGSVVEPPAPANLTGLDTGGWAKYVERVLEAGPPEELEEEAE